MDGETKGARTCQRLLDRAVARFAADGFRATTVSAIARDAGVTQAAVYPYFANKEALFEAAVDLDAARLIAGAQAEVDDSLPLALQVPTLLALLREGLDTHPLAHRVLAGREPEVIERLADLPALREVTAGLAATLAEAQAAGTLRADVDPTALAHGIETIVLSLLMSAAQVPGEADARVPGLLAAFHALLARSEIA